MTDSEKCAHDLAILYMQLEIKEGKIITSPGDDVTGFKNEYDFLFHKFLAQFK